MSTCSTLSWIASTEISSFSILGSKSAVTRSAIISKTSGLCLRPVASKALPMAALIFARSKETVFPSRLITLYMSFAPYKYDVSSDAAQKNVPRERGRRFLKRAHLRL